jgi:hypothetical protein
MEFVASNNEAKQKISNTVNEVNELSYSEKRDSLTKQAEIDRFLDHILDLKESLRKKNQGINNLNDLLYKIASFTGLDEDCLKLLNMLVGIGRDYYSTLERQYLKLAELEEQNIAIEEINEFGLSIDNLKENIDDLESIFFTLPKLPGFTDVTDELSSL